MTDWVSLEKCCELKYSTKNETFHIVYHFTYVSVYIYIIVTYTVE